MNPQKTIEIQTELERRKSILIELSHNPNFLMEPFERKRIQAFLERGGAPLNDPKQLKN
ncbi:hypothetical protein [Desulfobacula sp.]|uniref:hypothetical protein n=1 Tax=Desulfobacula sp. TaxID=2593537 RepID=UPI00261F64DC|nr:hypothetical protein [Desulfobacula sp.]